MNTTRFTMESTAQILIRCFWMGLLLQLLWFSVFLYGGQWAFQIHQGWWSGLTRETFDLINLVGISVLKTIVFVGFLLPYFAIRMVLRGNRLNSPRRNS